MYNSAARINMAILITTAASMTMDKTTKIGNAIPPVEAVATMAPIKNAPKSKPIGAGQVTPGLPKGGGNVTPHTKLSPNAAKYRMLDAKTAPIG